MIVHEKIFSFKIEFVKLTDKKSNVETLIKLISLWKLISYKIKSLPTYVHLRNKIVLNFSRFR